MTGLMSKMSENDRSNVPVLENIEEKNTGDKTKVISETSNNEAEQGHTGKLDDYDPSIDILIALRKGEKAKEHGVGRVALHARKLVACDHGEVESVKCFTGVFYMLKLNFGNLRTRQAMHKMHALNEARGKPYVQGGHARCQALVARLKFKGHDSSKEVLGVGCDSSTSFFFPFTPKLSLVHCFPRRQQLLQLRPTRAPPLLTSSRSRVSSAVRATVLSSPTGAESASREPRHLRSESLRSRERPLYSRHSLPPSLIDGLS
ncbi:putative mitochondrial protein [Cucumis melo var. makuwa]|uniref:Putative mitochondrial protein n=1 Tax=Cucumis melo var. makuwa TaxID=1194695 RepID=A0A5D3C9Y1_CUCMM|nr:putative mitochondrial protein [Cucumis melo var. makuwa]